MKFSYSPDGLDAGLCFTQDGVSVRLTSLAHTAELNAVECEEYARILLTFHEDVGRVRSVNDVDAAAAPSVLRGLEITDRPLDLIQPSPAPFVKYTSKDAFEQYYARGEFQLGSIIAYRNTPVASAMDPQEGYCNIVFRSRGEHHFATVRAGNNLRLFCGSTTVGDQYLKGKFGNVQLRLQDINGFGDAVANRVGARSWRYGAITYSRRKIFRIAEDVGFSVAPEDLAADPEVMAAFHAFVVCQCAPGTVFLKPQRHAPETESRFVFEMAVDVATDYHHFRDPSLLDFFQVSEG